MAWKLPFETVDVTVHEEYVLSRLVAHATVQGRLTHAAAAMPAPATERDESVNGFSLDLSDLVEVIKVPSTQELERALSRLTRSLGFAHWVYARELPFTPTIRAPLIVGAYPQAWVTHYFSQGYLQIDPVIAHCSAHMTPIIWPPLPSELTLPSTRRFFGEAHEFGLTCGLTIPLHGPGATWGVVSLSSDRPLSRQQLVEWSAHAMLLASFIHEAGCRFDSKGVSAPKAPKLTYREQECLSWAAVGKSSWEIGRVLGISERTVIFHLHNVCQKLGVTTRQSAVAKAIAIGLINP